MSRLLLLILSLSISGSIVAALLFLIRPLFRKRLSRTWQYYIWLVVILRLIIPWSPQMNFVGQVFERTQQRIISQAEQAKNLQSIEKFWIAEGDDAPQKRKAQNAILNLPLLITCIWVIWLSAFIMILVRKITGYRSFVQFVKAGRRSINNKAIKDIYLKVQEELGIRKAPSLYTNELITAPMLVGVFRPFIVLPTIDITPSETKLILYHELMHFKRGDIFYKWITQITVSLHWFNPIVYLLSQEINKSCELACDEAVITRLANEDIKSYGDILLATIKPNAGFSNTIISITLNEDTKLLKERLSAIMKYRKKSKVVVLASLFLTAMIMCVAAYSGVYVAAKVKPGNKPLPTSLSTNKGAEVTPMQIATVGKKQFYLVDTEEQLRSIGNEYPLSGNYLLNSNITLSKEIDWIPIGTSQNPFTGIFNGNGFEIVDLTISNQKVKIIGMFAYARNAQIYNVTLRNVDIEGAFTHGGSIAPFVVMARNCKLYDNTLIDPVEQMKR